MQHHAKTSSIRRRDQVSHTVAPVPAREYAVETGARSVRSRRQPVANDTRIRIVHWDIPRNRHRCGRECAHLKKYQAVK